VCPNDKFWATSKPKLLGASQHPDEGVCQFGSLILAMSQSSDTLLDHIADYLRFISNAKLFWCLLNTSYNYGRHLASQFHLDPEDYEVVSPLVAPPSRRLVVPAGCLNDSCCPLSSHCADLSSSCRASWLSHCLSPSSHCATLLSSCCTSY
jgi:hypothetical protein